MWVHPQIGQVDPGADTQSSHHSGGVFLYPGNSSSSIYLVYNGFMCQHVYEYTGPGLCGYCGLKTNDPNWDNINKGYSEYREKVGFFYNTNLWWTI